MHKVLVANRGEIALRVIRALRDMGLGSVAVYSEADRDSPHVFLADEAWCIGPAPAQESYLKIDRLLTAAKASGAQAVHPGYGFLAENDLFAHECEKAGLVFIGPKGDVLSRLANKAQTKRIVARSGVPVIPGSDGPVLNLNEAKANAHRIDYPILLKASFGGGGRGIYKVSDEKNLSHAWDVALCESQAATGKTELYIEKYLEESRHVEVQMARDKKGHTQAFIERDCTLQRRNQKILEETPSPFVTSQVRKKLLEAAVKATEACDLTALATVEFLLLKDLKTFYFLEINKRIQVEHPITEELLEIDLVRLQIELALGEALPQFALPDLGGRHAIEIRINAEDPKSQFLPTEGIVTTLNFPGGPGIRCDSYLQAGLAIGSFYDSLLAKIISFSSQGREGAIAQMKRALRELEISGLATTALLHQRLFEDPLFTSGKNWYSTRYLEEWIKTNLN